MNAQGHRTDRRVGIEIGKSSLEIVSAEVSGVVFGRILKPSTASRTQLSWVIVCQFSVACLTFPAGGHAAGSIAKSETPMFNA